MGQDRQIAAGTVSLCLSWGGVESGREKKEREDKNKGRRSFNV
jgi:hypothetical protein